MPLTPKQKEIMPRKSATNLIENNLIYMPDMIFSKNDILYRYEGKSFSYTDEIGTVQHLTPQAIDEKHPEGFLIVGKT
jgi:hypothetical protein